MALLLLRSSSTCRWSAALLVLALIPMVLVPTAASADPPPSVYLDQAGLSDAARPTALRFREYHSADLHTLVNASISGVSWSSWGGAMATGSGQALIQWTDAGTGLHAQAHAT